MKVRVGGAGRDAGVLELFHGLLLLCSSFHAAFLMAVRSARPLVGLVLDGAALVYAGDRAAEQRCSIRSLHGRAAGSSCIGCQFWAFSLPRQLRPRPQRPKMSWVLALRTCCPLGLRRQVEQYRVLLKTW